MTGTCSKLQEQSILLEKTFTLRNTSAQTHPTCLVQFGAKARAKSNISGVEKRQVFSRKFLPGKQPNNKDRMCLTTLQSICGARRTLSHPQMVDRRVFFFQEVLLSVGVFLKIWFAHHTVASLH